MFAGSFDRENRDARLYAVGILGLCGSAGLTAQHSFVFYLKSHSLRVLLIVRLLASYSCDPP